MPSGSKPFGIIQFFERFPNEEACLQHIFDAKFGNHSSCPSCHELGQWSRIKGTKKWRHACGKHISPLKETVMYRSNLSLMAWFYAFFLFSNTSIGMRAGFIRRQLGIGHNSAYRLCRMIRVHMAAMARPEKLGGEGKNVQIDEVQLRYIPSTAGQPNEAVIVFGLASEGQVLLAIVPGRRSKTLIPHIVARLMPGSQVVTDMLSGYRTLGTHGYEHIQINHSVAFHDFQGHSNNDIEAYWSTVRRMLRSARQVSRENMWTFLAEIEFKYNRRNFKGEIFDELIANFPKIDEQSISIIERKFEWSI